MKKKCPICKTQVEEDMVKLCQDAEDWIIQSLKRAHPDWVEQDGTCSKCLQQYKNLGKTDLDARGA